MLAKGSDPQLAAVAALDLAGAGELAKQIEVGDAWWALADSKQGDEQDLLRRCSGFWYRQAETNVQAGLDRLKLTQRLAEIAKLGRPITMTPLAPSASQPPPPAIAPFDAKKAKEHQAAWAKYLGVPVEMDEFDRHAVRADPAGRVRHGIDGSGGRQASGGSQSHEAAAAGTSTACPPRPPSIASGSRSRSGSVVTKSRAASSAGLWTIADTRPKPNGMAKVVTDWSTASGSKIRVSSGTGIWGSSRRTIIRW